MRDKKWVKVWSGIVGIALVTVLILTLIPAPTATTTAGGNPDCATQTVC
jgi:hypothetical protein